MKIASRFGWFFGLFLAIAAGGALADRPYPLDIPGIRKWKYVQNDEGESVRMDIDGEVPPAILLEKNDAD